jgi:arsenate reductase
MILMKQQKSSSVIFVCEHGAAKSIIAAAYFNKLSTERNLNVRAIARGTIPDVEMSPKALAGLQADGVAPTESIPQKLSLEEVENAQRVIAFCELPAEYRGDAVIEQWDNIPPVSEDYDKAREVIVKSIQRLINEIL